MSLLFIRCYQLNRLLYNFYPEKISWLSSEHTMSSCFATSWFIIIFSNNIFFTKDKHIPKLLLAIWDAFLIDGWKAIFKTATFFIGKIRDRLLGRSMSEITRIIKEFEKDVFKAGEIIEQEYRTEYNRIKVTNGIQ